MITKIAVLSLMAVFYISYFVKMMNQKKRGIHTDQLGKDKEGLIKLIEISLKISSCILPVIQVFSIVICQKNTSLWIQTTGVLIVAAGVLSFVLSITHMKDNWRAGVQKNANTSLVTDGIYSISRNPAFLGFDLMYLGIVISFYNSYLFFATVIVMILFHLQIVNVEEDFLMETFGEEYIQYKKEVHRYLGRKY